MRTPIRHIRGLGRTLWNLRPHLRGGRYLIFSIIFGSLLAASLESAAVVGLVPLLNLLLSGEGPKPMRVITMLQTAIPGHGSAFYVVCFCFLILAAICAKGLASYGTGVLSARLRRRIVTNLRGSLFARIHGGELSLFEQHTPGEMANLFFFETARTLNTVDLLLLVCNRASLGVFYVAVLVYFSFPLTVLTVALGSFVGVTMMGFYRMLASKSRQITSLNEVLSAHVLESFAGVRVVRATHSQGRVIEKFEELSNAQAAMDEKATRINQLIPPLTEVIAVAGAMTIVGCAYYFFVRSGKMINGHLLVFGFTLLRLLPILNQLYGLQGQLAFQSGGLAAVERWLDSPQFPIVPFGTGTFETVENKVSFEDISFSYPNGTLALENVSFEVPAGKTVAMVGASGAGKSTIALLLLRFRHPTQGKITVDGRDYWEFSPASWHKAIGVVEQEAFLFHDSLEKNIGYGFPEVNTDAVREAIRVAHLEDLIESLPEGLGTIVGERGTMLSGGQRQRLAIARALVRNPRILILDEATSALDPISERQVQVALDNAVRGRTVVVIAHRLSTIRTADWIVALDKGRVVEQGTWADLSSRRGYFRRLLDSSEGKNVITG